MATCTTRPPNLLCRLRPRLEAMAAHYFQDSTEHGYREVHSLMTASGGAIAAWVQCARGDGWVLAALLVPQQDVARANHSERAHMQACEWAQASKLHAPFQPALSLPFRPT